MEKVKLTRSELAMLDALIADLQEGENETSILTDADFKAAFIGGIIRVTRKIIRVTAKITPVTVRLIGRLPASLAAEAKGAGGLGELVGKDGNLSVDALIKLRKAAE